MKYACLLLFLCSTAYAQIAADCKNAVYLNISQDTTSFLSRGIPNGFGELQEVSARREETYYFSKEHHIAWYKFRAPVSGSLSFEIHPFDIRSNYDFILFKDSLANFCEEFKKNRPSAIRSVISQNEPRLESKTGLAESSSQIHIKEKSTKSFAKSLIVRKGESYYLVLDNEYGGGHGHRIDFHIYYTATLRGTLKELGTGNPLSGKVLLLDKEGKSIDSLKLEVFDKGEFSLSHELEYGKDYRLKGESPNHFDKKISYEISEKALDIELLPSKKGEEIIFKDINFHGNMATFLPKARPALKSLLEVMLAHPSLRIEIGGHVNYAGIFRRAYKLKKKSNQELSVRRAEAVKQYLVERGVDEDRIKCQGYGASQMLFPYARNERKRVLNRRVEIKVLDF